MTHDLPAPEPYIELLSLVDEHEKEGGVVHAELTQPPNENELGNVDPQNRVKCILEIDTFRVQREMLDVIGYYNQMDYTGPRIIVQGKETPEATWQNHDLTLLEVSSQLPGDLIVAEYLSARNLLKYAKQLRGDQIELFIRAKMLDECQATVEEIAEGLPPFPCSEDFDRIFDEHEATYEDVIIRRRNKIAVAAAARFGLSEPALPLAMIWGEDHLPGIGKGLERYGYERQATHFADIDF